MQRETSPVLLIFVCAKLHCRPTCVKTKIDLAIKVSVSVVQNKPRQKDVCIESVCVRSVFHVSIVH